MNSGNDGLAQLEFMVGEFGGEPIVFKEEVAFPVVPIDDLFDLIPDEPEFQAIRAQIVPGSGVVPVATFSIPEPTTLSLLILGGLLLTRRRRLT